MPDYRKLHKRAGQSRKVASLSDFEFRIWIQYRASADDYGVLPLQAATFQGENRRFRDVKPYRILRALKHLLEVGLIAEFEHQGQIYVCQLDWQDFEEVRYPRRSMNPAPPAALFARLSFNTAELFLKFHGNLPEELRSLPRAGARENQNPYPNQNQNPNRGESAREESAPLGIPAPNTWTRLVEGLPCGEHARQIWFGPTALLREYPNKLVVGVPTTLHLEWLPRHYSNAIAEELAKIAPGRSVEYRLLSGELQERTH